jgi:hypothetical protein
MHRARQRTWYRADLCLWSSMIGSCVCHVHTDCKVTPSCQRPPYLLLRRVSQAQPHSSPTIAVPSPTPCITRARAIMSSFDARRRDGSIGGCVLSTGGTELTVASTCSVADRIHHALDGDMYAPLIHPEPAVGNDFGRSHPWRSRSADILSQPGQTFGSIAREESNRIDEHTRRTAVH